MLIDQPTPMVKQRQSGNLVVYPGMPQMRNTNIIKNAGQISLYGWRMKAIFWWWERGVVTYSRNFSWVSDVWTAAGLFGPVAVSLPSSSMHSSISRKIRQVTSLHTPCIHSLVSSAMGRRPWSRLIISMSLAATRAGSLPSILWHGDY
jgi:hypothetical protein